MKEIIKKSFTNEEIEIIRSILLERSTFYTKDIVNLKISKLKAKEERFLDIFQSNIDFNFKLKNTIDKLYEFFK